MSSTVVLWLYGPAGVGKTTIAWKIYSQLADAGVGVAFVDIDQLGMCYPEQPSDPGRHRLKARNLAAVVANFAAAGARSVVVSGVVDPVRGPDADLGPGAALTTCRLRADSAELRQRLVGRDGNHAAADDAISEAVMLDASERSDLCVDTSGCTPSDVVHDVVERCGGWRALTGPARAAHALAPPGRATPSADVPVLLLCGATGVGKSAVGFEVYTGALRAGHCAAYIDLDQVGFCHSPLAADATSRALKAANLAALWTSYEAAGARRLIVVGPVESGRTAATYAAAVPGGNFMVCRLHAGPDELAARIRSRGQGGSWPQPGDPLAGRPLDYLRRAADRSARDAAALERADIAALRIDTDGRTVAAVADLVVSMAGWPT
jgi:predicted ABC-type ATPase